MNTINYNLIQISNEWLDYKKLYVKSSSYCKYKRTIKNHLLSLFKEHQVTPIQDSDIIRFFINKAKVENLSNNSLKSIKTILKSILLLAEKKYCYPLVNFDYIKIQTAKKEVTPLTEIEQSKLFKYCQKENNPTSIAIMIALFTGMRLGEICALKWDCVYLENKTISVIKSVQRVENMDNQESKTSLMIDEPKTKSSKREIVLPDFFIIFLREYYRHLKNTSDSKEYYVLTNTSKIMDPRALQYRYSRVCKKLGISTNFHALRHTFATNCVHIGVDIKTLSELLGHSNVSITLERYVHSSMEFKKQEINKLKKPKVFAD